ncbi:hypothetical protein HZU73_04326 [Apis mellifera caucasica]|nr:hypothetical protein HZU73_04326 [Apis mellifera caucasica]
MRISKEIDIYHNKDVVSTRKGRSKKEKTIYTCSGCKYESPRQYNVQRHNERIHLRQKLNICCGETFFTKGDYYVHCELCHPESRTHAITSRTKYKIVNNEVLPAGDQRCTKWPRRIMGKSYNMRLRSSNSKNDRVEELRTKVVSYEYSVREFDIENIPLISFIHDPRLKSRWLGQFGSTASSAIGKARPSEERAVKIEISSEQNVEKTVSTNGEEKRTKVSDSTVSSFSLELPAKKLILHRFRSSVREFEIPLREQNGVNNNNNSNNNNIGRRESTERTVKSVIPSAARQRRRERRRCKLGGSDKENLSNFSFSVEQQLNIKLDTGITVPMATQAHRDFLAAIDFDKFKIF